ncbi:hypothetical protein ZIOFF_032678 [Zingiber officinale]|uniref:Uncharacterized protein n=1 Tax=Zingiber officinale TaxID=94328 RepID=A0A8J5LBR4_ZINOF|nr:hypothetical protein ZIOFF_032678 [Zingiber officinale]
MPTLVVGSYEKFIWGFAFQPETLAVKSLFSYLPHTAPIKSVATAGPVAASGGADDSIKLYDLSSATEIGTLLDHNGSVTSLAFYFPPSSPAGLTRNLLSASDDGAVCIFNSDPFFHLKIIPVYRNDVMDLSVHPSGCAAITVGRESFLALINLVRGRKSFSCRLDRAASIARYGCGYGGRFFTVSEERITVHDSEDAKMIRELNRQKRLLCIAPAEDANKYNTHIKTDSLVLALHYIFYTGDMRSWEIAYSFENAHSTRVKGLVVLKNRSKSETSDESNLIASASSDGMIRVWDARMIAQDKPNHLAEADTKSRLTCLAGSFKKHTSSKYIQLHNTEPWGASVPQFSYKFIPSSFTVLAPEPLKSLHRCFHVYSREVFVRFRVQHLGPEWAYGLAKQSKPIEPLVRSTLVQWNSEPSPLGLVYLPERTSSAWGGRFLIMINTPQLTQPRSSTKSDCLLEGTCSLLDLCIGVPMPETSPRSYHWRSPLPVLVFATHTRLWHQGPHLLAVNIGVT